MESARKDSGGDVRLETRVIDRVIDQFDRLPDGSVQRVAMFVNQYVADRVVAADEARTRAREAANKAAQAAAEKEPEA